MPIKALTKATTALKERFPDAVIETEKIEGADRYQLLIVSDAFARIRPYRRQDIVWDIIKNAVTADEILKISFVLPVVASEISRMPKKRRRNEEGLQPR